MAADRHIGFVTLHIAGNIELETDRFEIIKQGKALLLCVLDEILEVLLAETCISGQAFDITSVISVAPHLDQHIRRELLAALIECLLIDEGEVIDLGELIIRALDRGVVCQRHIRVSDDLAVLDDRIAFHSSENVGEQAVHSVGDVLNIRGEPGVFSLREYGCILSVQHFELCGQALGQDRICINILAADVLDCTLCLHLCFAGEHRASCIVVIDRSKDIMLGEQTALLKEASGGVVGHEDRRSGIGPVFGVADQLCDLERLGFFGNVGSADLIDAVCIIFDHAHELRELVVEGLHFADTEDIVFDLLCVLAHCCFQLTLVFLNAFVQFIDGHLLLFRLLGHELIEELADD